MKGKVKAKGRPKKAGNLRARFAEEYAIDHNGTQAAIRAGYSPKTAAAAASRMLRDVKVDVKVNTLDTERSQRSAITADRVMQEYERLALLDPLDLFNSDGTLKTLAEMPEDARRAIAGLEVRELTADEGTLQAVLKKLKFADKKGALDSLAKIMGLMRETPPPPPPPVNILNVQVLSLAELKAMQALFERASNG